MTIAQTIKTAILLGITLALSGCGKAIATDTKNETQNSVETITRSDCLAKSSKVEKMVCLQHLAAQNERELSSLDDQIKTGEMRNRKIAQENEAMLEQFEEDVLDDAKPN